MQCNTQHSPCKPQTTKNLKFCMIKYGRRWPRLQCAIKFCRFPHRSHNRCYINSPHCSSSQITQFTHTSFDTNAHRIPARSIRARVYATESPKEACFHCRSAIQVWLLYGVNATEGGRTVKKVKRASDIVFKAVISALFKERARDRTKSESTHQASSSTQC